MASPKSSERRAAVIGAGQTGATAALGLLDAGFAVTLYSGRDQRSLRDDVPATGTALIFEEAQQAESALGLTSYTDRAPRHTGLSVRIAGPDGAELIDFDGAFAGFTGVAVDTRLKADDRITAFRERGGRFVVEQITPAELDSVAVQHDLTLVATGRDGLADLFGIDRDRSPYQSPQRTLLTVTVSGLGFGPDVFAHRGADGGAHSGFSIHAGQGEAWWGPYLHKDAGPTWAFLGWARPGSDWEKRFALADSAPSALRIAAELYRDYLDWDLPEVLATRALPDDEHSWLKGAVRPVVRSGVAHTADGRPIASLGDTSVAFDPIAGQGAQSGLIQAQRLVAAATGHDGPFDEAWIRAQHNSFLEARVDAANKVTSIFLGDPKYAALADTFFPAAAVSPTFAGALVGTLSRPQPLLGVDDGNAADLVTQITGEPAADVLARFQPAGRFARSGFRQ